MKGSFVRQKRWDCLTLGVIFFARVRACACKKRIMFVSLRERKCARLWGRDCVCVLTDLFKQRVARLFVCARKTSVWWFCLHFSLISADGECAYTWTRLRVSQLSLLLRWVKMEARQLKRAAASSCTASFQTVSERLCLFLLFLYFKASAVMHQTFFFNLNCNKNN